MSTSKQGKKNALKPAVPKPYIAYTLFFQLERAHILQQECPESTVLADRIDKEVVNTIDSATLDPVEHPRPVRYEKLLLLPFWYSSLHQRE